MPFEFWFFCGIFVLVLTWMRWNSKYHKVWDEYRTRNWTRVRGRFDEGEVVTMRRGRSNTISGYEVWFGYEYQTDGDQVGVYRLSERAEHEAEVAMKAMAHREITVRVNPRNPAKSFVSDEEI